MFDTYKNRMAIRGRDMSDMLRKQSNMVIEQTWVRDPNYRQVYVVRVNRGLPEVTMEHELIDVKFNIKTYQSITSDEAAYMLQFRHGEEKRHPEIALGSYVYMEDEDHEWKWWLICHLDERPQFRQYQILECNWTFGWVTGGKIYHCLGVQRVQQSYNSGSWDGDRLTFVDNITAAWLPTNDDTLTIGYNQRFIISDPRRRPPLAWSTSKIEDTQPEGLTKLKLTQEPFDPIHDNAELMLANYYDSPIEPEEPEVIVPAPKPIVITYSGTQPTIKVGGSWKTFTPHFDGENVALKQWVVQDENGTNIESMQDYTIEHDGDKLKLKVARNYNLIGKVLTVHATGTDGGTGEVQVEVTG